MLGVCLCNDSGPGLFSQVISDSWETRLNWRFRCRHIRVVFSAKSFDHVLSNSLFLLHFRWVHRWPDLKLPRISTFPEGKCWGFLRMESKLARVFPTVWFNYDFAPARRWVGTIIKKGQLPCCETSCMQYSPVKAVSALNNSHRRRILWGCSDNLRWPL